MEFCAWEQINKEQEFQQRQKWEYYLAEMIGYLKGKEKFRISEFLLDFGPGKSKPKPIKLTGEQWKAVAKRAFGIKD